MISLFDGAITIKRDTTPLSLDEETRALYSRAIAEPESLSDAERRRITHRPPAEEENALCRQACGLSMTELVAKAIDSSTILTYREAHLLTVGVVPGQHGRLLSQRVRLSEADADLTHRAAAAALTEEMKAAQEAARAVQQRWRIVQREAAKSLNYDDIRNIRYAMRVPWQERLVQCIQSQSTSTDGSSSVSSESEHGIVGCCGLVVFSDPERTAGYKSLVDRAVYNGLHYAPSLVNEEAMAGFTLHWVEAPVINRNEDNTVNLSALQSRFQTMLAKHEFPVGLRSDCFLYVDDEGLHSARPYLWLGEPVPRLGPGLDTHTDAGTVEVQTGPLKVDIKHIAPTLFARLVQRDLSGDAKRWPYRHTSELTMLHRAARHSRNSQGEPDGIWPPPSRCM